MQRRVYATRLAVAAIMTCVLAACRTPDTTTPARQAAPTAQPQSAASSARPTVPATAIPDEPIAQTQPTPISACTFPLPQAAPPVGAPPPLAAYHFTEPQVVQTEGLPRVSEWLPDNRQLLLTQKVSNPPRSALDLFAVDTGTFTRFGTISAAFDRPHWLAAQQAIAVAVPIFRGEQITGAALQLVAANGSVRELAPALENPFVVPTPDRRGMTILTLQQPGQPLVLAADGNAAPVALPSIARTAAEAAPHAANTPYWLDPWLTPRFVWRPDGSRLLAYTQDTILLLNPATQERCTLDLGSSDRRQRWALEAVWSPDGRYLALNTALDRERGDIYSTDIMIIDTIDGSSTMLEAPFSSSYGFAWLPNGRQFITIGKTYALSAGKRRTHLFLADFHTRQLVAVLPAFFTGTSEYHGGDGLLSLSADGQLLAFQCLKPTNLTEGAICITRITLQ